MTGNSMIHTYADRYLAQCRSLGFEMQGRESLLRSFADHIARHSRTQSITTALAVEWATASKSTSSSYRARRLSVARTFARCCAAFDPSTEIPPPGLLTSGCKRPTPYIYSPSQIQNLLDAAQNMRPTDGLRPHTYTTLFGLLASTGIRIGEALRLCVLDVRWDASALVIVNSKRLSERLVPLHPTTLDVLHEYAQRRSVYLTDPPVPTLFISDYGKPLGHSGVLGVFARLRAKAGIKTTGRKPRIHDLRHTFACNRILQWHQDGVPLDHALTSLSAYLGHVQPTDTYWYLTGIPELLDVCSAQFEQYARCHLKGELI